MGSCVDVYMRLQPEGSPINLQHEHLWSWDRVQISPYIKVTHGEIVLGIVVDMCENAYNACTLKNEIIFHLK